MHRLAHLVSNNHSLIYQAFSEKNPKVLVSLTKFVYLQLNLGILASLACAAIIFIGLFDSQKDNWPLFAWSVFYLSVTCLRAFISFIYKFDKQPDKHLALWRNFYVLGALLGGSSWGLAGLLLLPTIGHAQQILLILMLAGVTAGSVPLSAAIPGSAIAFLSFSLLPFILGIVFSKNHTYLLFDVALTLYFFYSLMLTLKTYALIRSAIILQFENDALLANLAINNKKLEEAATHDPLTKIANRRLFIATLDSMIKRAEKNNKLFGILFIDLDHFKEANDTYGHQAGDIILTTVVERLKKYFQTDGIIARLGGDELAIIIDNINEINQLEYIGQALCSLLSAPIKINGNSIKISASIGISVYPHDGQTESDLMRCADECMYRVKRNGGNDFAFSKRIKMLA